MWCMVWWTCIICLLALLRASRRQFSRKRKEAEEIAAKEEAKKAKEKRAKMVLEVNNCPRETRICFDMFFFFLWIHGLILVHWCM